ncbi:MAG: TolC family protein [Bacteroidetes bacterium]|nr:TolC family protein [Bacteroidota bacterium]
MTNRNKTFRSALVILVAFGLVSCVPTLVPKSGSLTQPESYSWQGDTTNSATINWRNYFADTNLTALIDLALANNQELNIILQEIEIARNEARVRKGEYLPFVNLKLGSGVEKVGRYTSQGANDANTEIAPGREFPEPLTDIALQASATWELDIWHKLRNARKAAVMRYLSSIEGRNFMVTQLVAEIAEAYYELMALDNQLDILKTNIQIQQNALKMVRQQKLAAKVTELAVKKFEAEVLKNQSNLFTIEQQIVETENWLNLLVGRYPQRIERSSVQFTKLKPDSLSTGVPSQLLLNRPDLRQAEQKLAASKLDIQVARANFYPSVGITAGLGYQAFNAEYLLQTPESMLYSIVGDVVQPLVNRNAIIANYYTANAKQIQAAYEYERAILQAYTEVVNQVSNLDNLQKSYDLKRQQVQTLNQSITISTNLFQSARADYMEVMLTQRDALEAKIEMVETKKEQLISTVQLYKALGGGWQ